MEYEDGIRIIDTTYGRFMGS